MRRRASTCTIPWTNLCNLVILLPLISISLSIAPPKNTNNLSDDEFIPREGEN